MWKIKDFLVDYLEKSNDIKNTSGTQLYFLYHFIFVSTDRNFEQF